MTRITLSPIREKFNIQIVLLDSLKEFGWKGNWEITDDSIYIESDVGVSLEEYIRETPLDYANGLRLALCLGEQLSKLSENDEQLGEKYGVLFFNLKDILVIDNNWFLLSNLSKVLPITDEIEMILQEPIAFDGFLAPELEGVDTLPLVVNPSCAYYSLALLCLKALELDFDGGLDRLNGSKFFYLLQRCLENDTNHRLFIYV